MLKTSNSFIATTTDPGKNRFKVPLYLVISEEGTIYPVSRKYRKRANRVANITLEYPTYYEELEYKKQATRYDRNEHIHYVDMDMLTELRVRRCLVQWDFDSVLPELGLTSRLHRIQGKLEDVSLAMWMQLPPLLRKHVSELVYQYIGQP